MLVIRTEQLSALGRAPRAAFEAELIRHFERFYPEECRRAGAGNVGDMVRLGIDRAGMHGYYVRREIGLYINLMVMLGSAFDRDPQIPWALKQLNDLSIADPFDRIQRIFESALDYLGACYGDGNEYMKRALVRIRDFDPALAPQSVGLAFENDLLELWREFCPQKFSTQPEEATRELIRQGMESAEKYGIVSSQGRVVVLTLMFFLGIGIDDDPLYPWAGEALRDPSLAVEQRRAAELHRAALAYVNDVLSE